MAQPVVLSVSREQYLRGEAVAQERSEYRDGEIYAMSQAGDPNHGTLVHALHIALGNGTEGTLCRSFGSEIKLRVDEADAYDHPDAMVMCGEMEVESETAGIIKNPAVVFEVLSPGTEAYDKNRKFLDYQTVPSLQEIVFLSSERKVAEHYERQGDGSWRYTAYLGDVTLPIGAAGLDLELARLYARLRFDDVG